MMQKSVLVLGKSGLEVSAIGLGCMDMTMVYEPPVDKNEIIKLFHKVADLGMAFICHC